MTRSSAVRARALVDLDAVQHNLREVRRLVGPGPRIWPAVKANAYGHGAVPVTHALAQAGADGFCVATPEEALEIRSAAGDLPILLLGAGCDDDIPGILESGAETVVADPEWAHHLSAAAERAGVTVAVHIKLDTGMGRIGVLPDAVVSFARTISELPGLHPKGLMTHFPSSDEVDLTHTRQQVSLLRDAAQKLQSTFGWELICHGANSGAILGLPESHLDAVRPGIMIYGCRPASSAAPANLLPVMTLSARIVLVKSVQPGDTVSYGRTWTAARPSIIATCSIGYGDGLPRKLSNIGRALVRGQSVPVAGRVCMDQTMLDVTDVPGVKVGDEAVFWGEQNGNHLDCLEVAEGIGTIPYELTCQLTQRVPRVYRSPSGLEVG